jgi:ATP-dependent RNA helicase DeaD
MEQFEKLGLGQGILKALSELRFERPSEIQEKAIPLAIAGKDLIAGSATGSGKTLAFASPIIEKLQPNGSVQALILAPTRELAEQIADSIKKFSKNKKLNVLSIYGGVNIQEQIRKIRYADIVVGTPGRIIDHLGRLTLNLNHVKFLVLDEVDRMFDMGFQRDVDKIISKCPKERQTMLFSATISDDITRMAMKHTRNAEEVAVESYVDHSKLKQIYYDVQGSMKFSLLVHLLKNEESNLIMIFCGTRRNVDFVANNLRTNQIDALAIHGGLTQDKRSKIMRKFQDRSIQVLVCTDIAARGLDIPGVSHVYNYDLPAISNDYIHRIGRTARAGKEGIAISILSSRDYENFGNIVENIALKIEAKELPKFGNIETRKSFDKRDDSRERGRFGGRSSGARPRRDGRTGESRGGFRGNHSRQQSSRPRSGRFSRGRSYSSHRR